MSDAGIEVFSATVANDLDEPPGVERHRDVVAPLAQR